MRSDLNNSEFVVALLNCVAGTTCDLKWDAAKAASNDQKHGVSFETAMLVFSDPYALTDQDRVEGHEYRWRTTGLINGVRFFWSRMWTARMMARKLFVSYLPGARTGLREGDMKKPVRHERDPANPPPLSEAQKAELRALEAMSDEQIDYSDIPPTPESFWRNACRNPYYRPVKQQLTLRLDADLIAWFKQHADGGRGYQSNINQALREFVEAQESKARRGLRP